MLTVNTRVTTKIMKLRSHHHIWKIDSGDSGLLIPMLEDAMTFMRLFKVGTLVLAFPQPCVK